MWLAHSRFIFSIASISRLTRSNSLRMPSMRMPSPDAIAASIVARLAAPTELANRAPPAPPVPVEASSSVAATSPHATTLPTYVAAVAVSAGGDRCRGSANPLWSVVGTLPSTPPSCGIASCGVNGCGVNVVTASVTAALPPSLDASMPSPSSPLSDSAS